MGSRPSCTEGCEACRRPEVVRSERCGWFAQVAASGDTQVVALEDVSAEMLERERKIELQKEDLQKKPEAIRCERAPHQGLQSGGWGGGGT